MTAVAYRELTRDVRVEFERHAPRGMSGSDFLDEIRDKPLQQTGTVVLVWPILAPMTGTRVGVGHLRMSANLNTTVEQRIADVDAGQDIVLHGKAEGFDGYDTGPVPPFSVRVRMADLYRGLVVREMPPVFLRQDPVQVIVNVPEQPAPVVNVNIEDAPTEQHMEVKFERDFRGELTGATIDGVEQQQTLFDD